jgi:hypothetical protein
MDRSGAANMLEANFKDLSLVIEEDSSTVCNVEGSTERSVYISQDIYDVFGILTEFRHNLHSSYFINIEKKMFLPLLLWVKVP